MELLTFLEPLSYMVTVIIFVSRCVILELISVLPIIEKCGRLSIVEGHDWEALLRLLSGNLTQEQLWQWLSIPGAASAEDLPMKEYSFN